MATETLYDILGLRPDASHREVVHAFSRLAEHFRKEMQSDPTARERFREVKLAYETLTNYDSRLSYNIEHGFPDPPRNRKGGAPAGIFGQTGVLVPENWPVLLPWLFLVVGGNVAYYLLVGDLPWGFVSGTADHIIYAIGVVLFITLAALLSRERGSK